MSQLNVLLVDDEKELVFTMAERMELRGFKARAALSGDEAIRRLSEEPYSVVVLDLKMPGMRGVDALKMIRLEYPTIPVIIMTGHGSIRDGEEGMRSGAVACLTKPFEIEELIVKIREATGS
jgi:DNA-binding response OmpR family regulator